jgi:hypothetical protein
MSSLEHGRFCQEVVNQTGLLVATLEGAELSATVPTAPDWSLSDLVRHVGGNLRSVEQAVRTGEPVTDPEGQVEEHFGPAGGDPAPLFAWLTEAAGRFASTLGAAGPGVEAQVWTVRWPTAAWAAPPTTSSSTAPTAPARPAPPSPPPPTWPPTPLTSSST